MKKDLFVTLKFKLETAEEFRRFSRDLKKQQTETLQLMLNFFRNNNLNPSENLGPNMKTLEGNLNKRINGLIAIIKEIEKTQTKPVLAMLQLLFQEDSHRKKELLLEKSLVSTQNIKSNAPTEQEMQLKKKLLETRTEMKLLLDKVVVVRNNFGRSYLRLNLSKEDIERLQAKYNT